MAPFRGLPHTTGSAGGFDWVCLDKTLDAVPQIPQLTQVWLCCPRRGIEAMSRNRRRIGTLEWWNSGMMGCLGRRGGENWVCFARSAPTNWVCLYNTPRPSSPRPRPTRPCPEIGLFVQRARERREATGSQAERSRCNSPLNPQSAIERLALFCTTAHRLSRLASFRMIIYHGDMEATENEAEASLPGELREFGSWPATRPHVPSFRFQIINRNS
jgi:hypothetical protein